MRVRKELSGRSKEELRDLPATNFELTRAQFRTIRELYFERLPGGVHEVLVTAQRMGVPKLGNSDLVGNAARKVQGLIKRYRWDKKRGEIERRLREEETVPDQAVRPEEDSIIRIN